MGKRHRVWRVRDESTKRQNEDGFMKRVLKRLAWMGFMAVIAAAPAMAEDNVLPPLNEGIDQLAERLTGAIATRYFDADKRPVIKVAIFDFTNARGDITVGSRYVSERIRLAFGTGPQFEMLPEGEGGKKALLITPERFRDDAALKQRLVSEFKADVYLLGTIRTVGESTVVCDLSLWGTQPPFHDYGAVVPLGPDVFKAEGPMPVTWALTLTPSGRRHFSRVRVAGVEHRETASAEEDLARVIFLTQPMCDDLNLSWQVRADGMIYDIRKRQDTGSLRNRTGQIMQSRVKSTAALKELSYVIKNFTLTIKETGGEAVRLEPYVIPRESPYYFIPYLGGEKGLRFIYLWNRPGKSRSPSSREFGTGWSLYRAEFDWPNIMPIGTHVATATLEPIAETDYGTKRSRSEYVIRFKFAVTRGLNIYVINYVYRRDRPEIFVRRLLIEGTEDQPVKSVKRIVEVYEVYGAADQQSSGDR